MEVPFVDPATGERRLFSPVRDIANCWPSIVARACQFLEPSRWDAAVKAMAGDDVRHEDLLLAYVSFVRGMERALDPAMTSVVDTLRAVGFFDHDPRARAIVLYRIGQATFGAFWAGIRSATPAARVPADLESLVQGATQILAYVQRERETSGSRGATTPSGLTEGTADGTSETA